MCLLVCWFDCVLVCLFVLDCMCVCLVCFVVFWFGLSCVFALFVLLLFRIILFDMCCVFVCLRVCLFACLFV